MSLDTTLTLKLIYGQEIRKVHVLPATVQELRQVLKDLYGSTDFQIRYLDEENDPITIENDSELIYAYKTAKGPSLKILLNFGTDTTLRDLDAISMTSISNPPTTRATFQAEEEKTSEEFMTVEDTPERPKEGCCGIPEDSYSSLRGCCGIPKDCCSGSKGCCGIPKDCCDLKEVCSQFFKSCCKGKPEKRPQAPEQCCPLGNGLNMLKKSLFRMVSGGFNTVKKHNKRQEFIKNLIKTEVSRSLGVEPEVVHPNVTCDGCDTYPIIGVRYQCTVCPNFDFCELCEATVEHPHPFLKIKIPDPTIKQVRCGFTGMDENAIKKTFKNFKKMMKGDKRFRMDFLRHCNIKEEEFVLPGIKVFKSWMVKNAGDAAWPEGTTLQFIKGDIQAEETPVPPVASGEEVEIGTTITMPEREGKYHSVFRLVTPEGQAFGEKLHLRVSVRGPEFQPSEEQVAQLESMGFHNREEIISLLALYNGDVSLVASQLLSQ